MKRLRRVAGSGDEDALLRLLPSKGAVESLQFWPALRWIANVLPERRPFRDQDDPGK